MLVEINLLPEREPRKFAFVVILSCMTAAMVLVGIFYFIQIHFVKNEMTSIDRQITMTKRIANKQNNSVETVAASSSITQIKDAVNWANTYPIQTIPVMDHLTSLLPERGFIQSFSYTEGGTISITAQFDSAREAAYFLNSLNNSDWFEEANLNSLSTAESPGQTATATEATNTVSTVQNGQTVPVVTSDDSANENNQEQSTGQVQNNQTTATASLTNSTKKTTILPRYTGQYDIKLNKETVNKIIHKSESEAEGGTGS